MNNLPAMMMVSEDSLCDSFLKCCLDLVLLTQYSAHCVVLTQIPLISFCIALQHLWHFLCLYSFSLQDTVSGFLLAGVGHRTATGANFLIVKQDTKLQQVEEAFQNFSTRDDVGIILINQHIANDIRHVLKDYNATIPTVLEIPSKEHPYNPEQDYIMQRVNMFLGGGM